MLELTDDVRQGLAKTAGHGALSFNTEEYAKAMDLKNSADDSFNVRGLPGGTFGQSVIDSTLGVAGNIDDFFGGPTGLGDYANNYVPALVGACSTTPCVGLVICGFSSLPSATTGSVRKPELSTFCCAVKRPVSGSIQCM